MRTKECELIESGDTFRLLAVYRHSLISLCVQQYILNVQDLSDHFQIFLYSVIVIIAVYKAPSLQPWDITYVPQLHKPTQHAKTTYKVYLIYYQNFMT